MVSSRDQSMPSKAFELDSKATPSKLQYQTSSQTDGGHNRATTGPSIYETPPPPYTPSEDSTARSDPTDCLLTPSRSPAPLPSIPQAPAPNPALVNSLIQKPIAIPATSSKVGSPFLRAWAPILESHSMPKESFLTFIDNLNRVAVANPPLQILGLTGTVVGFVPLATAQIVGNSVSAAATLGTIALSKGRTEIYLREANRELFGPRGLKAEIAKIEAIAKLTNMPFLNAKGKIDKHLSLLTPLEHFEDGNSASGQQRRLQALEPWIAELEVTPLPEINVPSNPLSRLSASASERMRTKGEEKMLKERNKGHGEYEKEIGKIEKEFEKEMRKLDKEEEKARKKEKEWKLEKEISKIEKERQKVIREAEKESMKLEKDKIKDDKEEEAMRKILWLTIRNVGDDSGSGENPDMDY